MNDKNKTYTYTARNLENPDNVVTFTLDEEKMRVNLTDLMDETYKVANSNSKRTELMHQVKSKITPVLMKIRERIFGPVNVSDVNARLKEDNHFLVRMWPRIGGLRFMPVRINMGEVDNQDAAEAFVDELKQRKESEPSAHKFFGPFDYWFGWAGLMVLLGLFIRRYRQSPA